MIGVTLVVAVCASLFAFAPGCGDRALSGIEITTPPAKTAYVAGQKFDKTGMVVTAKFDDKTEEAVTEYTVSPDGALALTDTEITVTYNDKTATQKITVAEKAVTGLSIIAGPTKTAYVVGQKFDKSGMEVTAAYNDGTSRIVTGFTVSPAGALALTDKKVVVSYEGKTAEQAITVTAKAVARLEITKAPDKTEYTEGQKFDRTGMEVTAVYNDGSSVKVTDFTVSPDRALATADAKVVISYGGATADVAIKVKAKAVTKLEITKAPDTTDYVAGQAFDPTGMIVSATFDNGTTAEVTDYTVSPAGALDESVKAVTVSYGGKNAVQSVTVVVKEISGIEVTKYPDKVSYAVGETFDPAGMEVTATYNDNTTGIIADYTFAPSAPLTADVTGITIACGGFTDTVAITVVGITGIVVAVMPNKTSYSAGDIFDPTGLVIAYAKSDGSREIIEDAFVLPTAPLKAGDTYVTVTYGDHSVDVPVTVTAETVVLEAENASLTDYSDGTNIGTKGEGHWMNDHASGKSFVCEVNGGDVIAFAYQSNAARTARLVLRGASNFAYLKTGSYFPTYVKELQLNKVMDVTVNGTSVTLTDDVKLPGSGTDETGAEDKWYWVNWAEIDLGEIALLEGYNEIALTFKNPEGYRQPYNWEEGKQYGDAIGQYDCIMLQFDAGIAEKHVTGISVDAEATLSEYIEGQRVSKPQTAVTATYSDGSSARVANFAVEPAGGLTMEDTSFTVIYGNYTASHAVTVVAKALTGIEISAPPVKTDYAVGQTFRTEGMVVSALYNDGGRVPVSDYTYAPDGALTAGDTQITVSYGGFSAAVPITLQEADVIDALTLAGVPADSYNEGDEAPVIDASALTVTAVYLSGKTETLDPSAYSVELPTGTLTVGSAVVATLNDDPAIKGVAPLKVSRTIEASTDLCNTGSNIKTRNVNNASENTMLTLENASGKDYIYDLFEGDRLTFTMNSANAGKGSLTLKASSTYCTQYKGYTPVVIAEMQVNRIFSLTVNGKEIAIADDVVLSGKTAETADGDFRLLANWTNVSFEDIGFIAGENVIEFTFKTFPQKNQDGSQPSPYVDTLTINFGA